MSDAGNEPWGLITEEELPAEDDIFDLDLEEAEIFELEAEALRLEDGRELLKGRRQDRRERKRYAERIFRLVCCWLGAAMGLVLFCGLHILELADQLLVTLVGGTTASVVAIFVVVAKYLFPARGE